MRKTQRLWIRGFLLTGLSLAGALFSMASEIQILADVPFLGPERTEKMDAYLPDNGHARPTPAVLLIHGGGWTTGDKADPRERDIASSLAQHGYAVFSINYALNEKSSDSPPRLKTAWPQNFYDCKSALRFLRAEAGRFGLDPRRIAVMGGSAGGHLALLIGATAHVAALNHAGLYPEMSNDVACVIDFYGRHDVRDVARLFAGVTAEETAANVAAASPLTYLDARTPPTLIAHGTADTTIPVEVSRALAQELRTRSIPYVYVEIEGAPHTFNLHSSQLNLEPIVLTFLERHLRAAR